MTDHNEDPSADIAWMRRLAEENAQTPLQGASILFAAGLIFGLGSLGHWAVAKGLTGLEISAVGAIWLGALILFMIVLVATLVRRSRSGGVRTSANRAAGTAWASVGWGIFALSASMAVLAWRLGEAAAMVSYALMPSMIMVFYGSGWAVSAAMQRSKALWTLAIASFAAAPLLALMTGSADLYIAYAAALFLLMALPGWMLMRQARA